MTRMDAIADNGAVDDPILVGESGMGSVKFPQVFQRLWSDGRQIETTVPVLRVHYNAADDGRGVALDCSLESKEEEDWKVGGYVNLSNEQTRELIDILQQTIQPQENNADH